MWCSPSQLRARGILGMNQRNIHYIGAFNNRRLFPLVDDKLKTKLLARQHGIPTPDLISVVRSQFETRQIAEQLAGHPGFVIKPAKGSGGKGILVIAAQEDDVYVKSSGMKVSRVALERHMSNILSGLYSLGGAPDIAILEERIETSAYLAGFCHAGIPDIRIIVFRGYPVMSMIRLSTSMSDGKANLHQGAVGLGLDISTGRAVRAIQFDQLCKRHPDTAALLGELSIQDWPQLLEIASNCYEMTGLGYLGVDLAIDKTRGPVLLELNARPGLSIQIANNDGLAHRLKIIESQPDNVPVNERVGFSIRHFSSLSASAHPLV